MTLVSFGCQQACLFFSEGVGFSGLLNPTGRFVPGPQPDARTGEEGADTNRVKKKRATQMETGEWRGWFVTSCTSVVPVGSRG